MARPLLWTLADIETMGASFLIADGVIAAVSVPLILKLVPPNRLYGFRTSQTLSDRTLWFRANHFAGWALLIAAIVSASVFLLRPEWAAGASPYGLVVFMAPLLGAVGATLAHLRKINAGGVVRNRNDD